MAIQIFYEDEGDAGGENQGPIINNPFPGPSWISSFPVIRYAPSRRPFA